MKGSFAAGNALPYTVSNTVSDAVAPPLNALADRFAAHRHRRPAPSEAEAMLERVRAAFRRPIATIDAIEAVDAVTGSTIWLVEDGGAPLGVSLWVPLSLAGAQAMLERRFTPEAVGERWLAPAGTPPAAVYHWGFAGFSRESRRSIMTLCAELLEGPLSGINVYGRVVTEEGAAAVARLGIEPCFELGAGFYVHRARTPAPALGAVA
jgi:hypothetical protein